MNIFSALIRWKPSSRISRLADIELKSVHLIDGKNSGVAGTKPGGDSKEDPTGTQESKE